MPFLPTRAPPFFAAPHRSWSPRLGTLNLGHMSANDYHCFGPNCYQLTGHLPTSSQLCLAHVLSYDANVGTSPNDAGAAGVDVWGGPLANGDFVVGLVNRDGAAARAIAIFAQTYDAIPD